jgi:hypothetical protein
MENMRGRRVEINSTDTPSVGLGDPGQADKVAEPGGSNGGYTAQTDFSVGGTGGVQPSAVAIEAQPLGALKELKIIVAGHATDNTSIPIAAGDR